MPGLTTRHASTSLAARVGLAARQHATVIVAASPVVAAVLYTLATPPFTLAALAWVVAGTLLAGAERASPPRAFLHGALFGLLIACGITSWAPGAAAAYFGGSRVAAASFALAVWLVFSALPYGLLTLAYRLIAPRVPGWSVPLCAAWLWVACEWLRTVLLTGLPWGFLAHTQWRATTLLQVADLGGVYAVSFVVAYAGTALVRGMLALPARERPASAIVLQTWLPAAGLVVAVLLYGESRLSALAPDARASASARQVAIVQVDAPARLHWQRAAAMRTVALYAAETRATPGAALVVWPESAVAFYPDEDALLRTQLAQVARASGAPLLFGASRRAADGSARNAVFLLDERGAIRGSYDKQRLLPFAEYDPLDTSAPARGLAYAAGGLAAPIDAAGMHLGALVCYEALFPALARARVLEGADVLVNLSNDAWLDGGDGAARAQHFAMTVFRAIETRRPLVRASAGGISGAVAATGEVQDALPAGRGTLRVAVAPGAGSTAYVRFGDAWIALGGLLVGALVVSPRRRPC
ncbi:MAG: apolipoprotein N-acyltransferase [Thermodesulfobacteriota bacterium]